MCFQHTLQILGKLNMWILKYELWKRTAHSDRNVNIQMYNTTLQMITLLHVCCVCYDDKQSKTFFSDYYKTKTYVQKHKMLKASFKTLSCIY